MYVYFQLPVKKYVLPFGYRRAGVEPTPPPQVFLHNFWLAEAMKTKFWLIQVNNKTDREV